MKIELKGLLGVKHQASFLTCLAAGGLLLLPGHVLADPDVETLSGGGSTATVDLDNGGMNNWSVNNQNQLTQQWFWYSVNGGAANPINQIGNLTYSQPQANILDATYQNSQISVTIQYTLAGGGMGSGNADITENIYIDNNTANTFTNLNFYQYSNFNLLQENNNSLQIFADRDIHGNIIGYDEAQQSIGATSIAEGIIAPDANYAEAGTASQVYNDVSTGLMLNGNLTAGPGNVAWGFEWSTALDGGDEFAIEKDKSLSVSGVPEPSTIALITLGLGACGFLRRRQSS